MSFKKISVISFEYQPTTTNSDMMGPNILNIAKAKIIFQLCLYYLF